MQAIQRQVEDLSVLLVELRGSEAGFVLREVQIKVEQRVICKSPEWRTAVLLIRPEPIRASRDGALEHGESGAVLPRKRLAI